MLECIDGAQTDVVFQCVHLSIYLYIFVEPSSFAHKLLLQRVCDGRETWPYYRPHGECHKGVCGKLFVVPEKSAAQIPNVTKLDAMFLCIYGDDARFQASFCAYMCKKAAQCPRATRALWHAKAPCIWLQLQNEGAAKKIPSRQTVG